MLTRYNIVILPFSNINRKRIIKIRHKYVISIRRLIISLKHRTFTQILQFFTRTLVFVVYVCYVRYLYEPDIFCIDGSNGFYLSPFPIYDRSVDDLSIWSNLLRSSVFNESSNGVGVLRCKNKIKKIFSISANVHCSHLFACENAQKYLPQWLLVIVSVWIG